MTRRRALRQRWRPGQGKHDACLGVTAMSTTACCRAGGRRLRTAEHAAALACISYLSVSHDSPEVVPLGCAAFFAFPPGAVLEHGMSSIVLERRSIATAASAALPLTASVTAVSSANAQVLPPACIVSKPPPLRLDGSRRLGRRGYPLHHRAGKVRRRTALARQF